MSKAYLQGCVFSLPAGLGTGDYYRYYNEWIKPYLSMVYSNPEFKFFFYISGIIFEYLKKEAKESLDLLVELSERKQVEILHGMYYDTAAMLQSTVKEQKDQLEKTSHFISVHNLDALSSRGCWLTPGTYEHQIVGTISQQGHKFMVIDRAYLEPPPPDGTLGIVETMGKQLTVYPFDRVHDFSQESDIPTRSIISQLLRSSANKVIMVMSAYYQGIDTKVYFANMSKMLKDLKDAGVQGFSAVPSHYIQHNYDRQYLCRIRSAPYGVEDFSSFSHYLITRYESRLLYCYYLYLLKKVSKYKKDKARKNNAILCLNRMHSHFYYWKYSEEWGIHNSTMRQYAYQELGNVEEDIVSDASVKNTISLLSTDYNTDGVNEIVVGSNSMMVVLEPKYGSCILWQKRQKKNKRWNYLSCYVPYVKPVTFCSSFREMILVEGKHVDHLHENILNNSYPYSLVEYENVSTSSMQSSVIYSSQLVSPFSLEKEYIFSKNNNIQIKYRLNNVGMDGGTTEEQHMNVCFVVEVNLSLLDLTVSDLDDTELEIFHDDRKISSNETYKGSGSLLTITSLSRLERMSIAVSNNRQFGLSMAPVVGTDSIVNKNQYQYHSLLLYFTSTISSQNYETYELQIAFSNIRRGN